MKQSWLYVNLYDMTFLNDTEAYVWAAIIVIVCAIAMVQVARTIK